MKAGMRSLIISTADKNIKKWCNYTREASYRRNISYHQAIKLTPYQAVYGIKPHREKIPSTEESTQNQSEEENCDQEGIEETPRKRQKTKQNTTLIWCSRQNENNKSKNPSLKYQIW